MEIAKIKTLKRKEKTSSLLRSRRKPAGWRRVNEGKKVMRTDWKVDKKESVQPQEGF